MLRPSAFLLFSEGLLGCFSPTIPSESFRCAENEPFCPEGQSCCMDQICRVSCEADGGSTDMATDAGKGEPDLTLVERPKGSGVCADDSIKGDPDNNIFDRASEIDADLTSLKGLQICWPGDVDYYRYALAAGERIRVTVEFIHADGDLDAVLQSPAGGAFLDTAQGTSDNELLEMSAPAESDGDYRIAVYGYASAVNVYSLSIDRLP